MKDRGRRDNIVVDCAATTIDRRLSLATDAKHLAKGLFFCQRNARPRRNLARSEKGRQGAANFPF
jgi:hypothetical protein